MSRMIRSLLLVTCLSAGTAAAQGGMGPGRGMGMGMGMGMGGGLDDASFGPTIAMLTTMLNLTPEQQRAVIPLRDTLLIATAGGRAEASAVRAAMQEARRRGAGADSLAVLRTQMRNAMMALMPARMAFHDKLRALLTDEQARVLDAHHQDMMGPMGQRMGEAPPR